MHGVEILETLDDDVAGFPFVGGGDFLGGQGTGDGDFAVEVVGVGGAEAGDSTASLGEGYGGAGMGVDDGANLREGEEEAAMGGGVG